MNYRLDVDIAAATLIAKMSLLPEHGNDSDTGTRQRLLLLRKKLSEHLGVQDDECSCKTQREKKSARRKRLLLLRN